MSRSANQEIILDMHSIYPFNVAPFWSLPSNHRIYCRRVMGSTAQTYAMLKMKLDQARRLSNPTAIRLVRVLEEEGLFYLFYEFVPRSVEAELGKLTAERVGVLKGELILLATELAEKRISTQFEATSLGIDHDGKFKYYVDLGGAASSGSKDAQLQNGYICQINRMCRGLLARAEKFQKWTSEGETNDPNPFPLCSPTSPASPKTKTKLEKRQNQQLLSPKSF